MSAWVSDQRHGAERVESSRGRSNSQPEPFASGAVKFVCVHASGLNRPGRPGPGPHLRVMSKLRTLLTHLLTRAYSFGSLARFPGGKMIPVALKEIEKKRKKSSRQYYRVTHRVKIPGASEERASRLGTRKPLWYSGCPA